MTTRTPERMPPQVRPDHYGWRDYDTKPRFASYWHQAREVLEAGPTTCLEIGGGNGFVRRYLERWGVRVVTVDIDERLRPDRLGDVRALPCETAEFDVVLCAEVLEHLPFTDLPRALGELRRVCRRRAVVSLPQIGRYFELTLRIPPFRRVAVVGRLPSRHGFVFDGQHHWELGARGARAGKVRATIRRSFEIEREYPVPEHPYHRVFVLEPA